MEEKKTFWKYFMSKPSGVAASAFCIGLSIYSVIDQILENTGDWYFGLYFIFMGVVFIPFGVYMNYKKYWV